MGMVKPYSAILPAIGAQVPFAQGMLSQGQAWFVNPYSGSDSYTGKRPDRPLKTLAQALSNAVANRNDVVYMFENSNTAASTTDYQTAVLDWNKDAVHLIGVNNGPALGQRSRIAWKSTATAAATELFRLTANNCLIANIEMFQGLAAATSMTGCMSVVGMRNKIYNCQISGIGHDDNDIAGAYSLYLNGGKENLFERCYIGLDTVDRGTAANYEILLDNGVDRTEFKDCKIVSRIQHNTNHPQIKVGSAAALSQPSYVLFDQCKFINTSVGGAYTNTYILTGGSAVTNGGQFIFNMPCVSGEGTGLAASGDHVYLVSPLINTAYTGGKGYVA